LDYYFQGLTENGQFYISFKWPVSTNRLPDTAEAASDAASEQASNSDSYETYVEATKETLNDLPPAAWSPDLVLLDDMIASLEFQLD
jgi:hypothetical protein